MASSTRRIGVSKTTRQRSFMAQPVKLTSGLYQLRRKVPLDLRQALGHEYKRSLNTRDPVEAKIKFAEEWVRSDAAFGLARAQLAGANLLSVRDTRVLASRWYQVALKAMESTGRFVDHLVVSSAIVVDHGDSYEEYTPLMSMREALAGDPDHDFLPIIAANAKATLRDKGIPMPASGTERFHQLIQAFYEHALLLSDVAKQRHEGDWDTHAKVILDEPLSVETKRLAPEPKTLKLLAVFEAYGQDKALNDGNQRGVRRTIDSYRAIIEQFIELAGEPHIAKVSRDTIRRYRADLVKLPAKGNGIRALTARQLIAKAEAEGLPLITEATVRNKLRAVSAVLSYAVHMGHIAENPVIAGGFGKAAAKAASNRSALTRRRNEYNEAELKQIFESVIYTDKGWSPPRANFGKAWYWMPLLMYYTGARREELAQLNVKDVQVTESGIWHLNILATDDDDVGRGVKTIGSRRLIPLHPDVLTLGLDDYLKSLPPHGQLFPLLKPNPHGYYGANFGKRWAEYLRVTVGLITSARPSHGFRHTFITLCRQVGISEEVHDAITGHASNATVGRGYGSMPLERMAEEIKRLPSLLDVVRNSAVSVSFKA